MSSKAPYADQTRLLIAAQLTSMWKWNIFAEKKTFFFGV